jgi:hypothetical protein
MAKLCGKLKEFIRQRKWKIKIKTWVLLLLLIPLLAADATLMRLNHIKMTELRDAVLAIDEKISEKEADEDVQEIEEELKTALIDLKGFVFSHIVINVVEENGLQRITFGTGPFYLENQYLRAATKALKEAEKNMASDNNPYGNIYGMAGEVCEQQAAIYGWIWSSAGYINCMMSEIQKYPASDEIQDTIIASLPSTELYRKNYASPVWAPTPLGFLFLLTLIIIVVIIIRLIIWIILRISLFFI